MVKQVQLDIGYGKPPNQNKYYFNELEVGEEKLIMGKYDLVRVAANTYSRKHGVKVIAVRTPKEILIKRLK